MGHRSAYNVIISVIRLIFNVGALYKIILCIPKQIRLPHTYIHTNIYEHIYTSIHFQAIHHTIM